MDLANIVTSLPPWILFILMVVFCVLAAEAGSLVARKKVLPAQLQRSPAIVKGSERNNVN